MYFLSKDLFFPPVTEASPEGIVAVGGDLSTQRLLLAYKNGIFPWFNANEPILWWSPPMRMVVFPKTYSVSKRMKQILKQNDFKVTMNRNFKSVILQCQTIKRKGQVGTWITDDIVTSYCKLHEAGVAKSIEVWQNNELVGGLYGIDLGTVFCGESMFSKVSNASKVAFISLIEYLKINNYTLLDCQIHNDYLAKLGAFEIPRDEFVRYLEGV